MNIIVSDAGKQAEPKLIKLHPDDNVALATQAIAAGANLDIDGIKIIVQSDIKAMHKVAITAIAVDQPIYKYGQPIGTATALIAAGEHVHVHNCGMSTEDKDYGFCRVAKTTDFVKPEEQAHFMGYKRASGAVGTRNFLGIITTVNCSATVASQIAANFNYPGALDAYANIDGIVALTHEGGCGMRSAGEGYEMLERVLTGYARHPNFGGILVIGLGCETMQLQRLTTENNLEESTLFQSLNIQEAGGTRISIEKGLAAIKAMLPELNALKREKVPASHLTVALQCGGSDAFSGITANPALGAAADLVIRNGGTAIYSETPEIYGAEHLLTQRSASPEIAQKVLDRITWWEHYTSSNGFELNNNPSPGNKVGGLTTISEKSLGAQAKSGTTELRAVYLYAEAITEKGLVFMDSPGFDPVSVTGQVASGANVICFTTGRGSAFGFKPVPCIKLGSNDALYAQMEEDIDINCGGIVSGRSSVAECGLDIFNEILAVASGKPSKSEDLGYGLNEFNPWRIGATV
ncbi:MAG: altronate dehydratase family protein [Marinagarivorans sp.]|nr:altronate dehydratase family protein [Marinagarivorans sp.]